MSIWDIFRRRPPAPAPSARDLLPLPTGAPPTRGPVASTGWSWTGGLGTSWSGEKFPGALQYATGWSFNHEQLRRRSRIAYWDSPQARALLGRLVDNVVGTGLRLESAPVWRLVAPEWSEEQKQAWIDAVEARFHLWASSKEADATGRMNFYRMQAFHLLNYLRDGETFKVQRFSPDRGRMNPLEIQFLKPEQVYSPTNKTAGGATIQDGIEMDANGKPVAYHVLNEATGKPVRIPARGEKSGRQFVLHSAIIDAVGQVRGIPVLANLVHELQKLTDYQIAEIEAAVVNATIAAWIEPSQEAPASRAFAGLAEADSSQAKTDAGDTRRAPPEIGYIRAPGLMVQNLKAGEKLNSYDTKRPNVNFENFLKAWKSSFSASLGIPVEVLDMTFGQNYSASRASLLLFWTVVERWRETMADDLLNPVYASWLAEEVRAGRVDAPGWEIPVLQAAWLNADWIGIPYPAIDPLKEANAANARIAAGLTTREREAREYNRSEFSENVSRLKVENEQLAEANASMQPAPAAADELPEREDEDE